MWLVWRPGAPNPSRPSPAVHHDDPAKDRKDGARETRLAVIPIASEHRGLPIAELVRLEAYKAPPVTADA